MKRGDKGAEVLAVQKALVQLGFKPATDGVFGNRTEAAVLNFQYTYGLPRTGVMEQTDLNALRNFISAPDAQLPAEEWMKYEEYQGQVMTAGGGLPDKIFGIDSKWVLIGLAGLAAFYFMGKKEE